MRISFPSRDVTVDFRHLALALIGFSGVFVTIVDTVDVALSGEPTTCVLQEGHTDAPLKTPDTGGVPRAPEVELERGAAEGGVASVAFKPEFSPMIATFDFRAYPRNTNRAYQLQFLPEYPLRVRHFPAMHLLLQVLGPVGLRAVSMNLLLPWNHEVLVQKCSLLMKISAMVTMG